MAVKNENNPSLQNPVPATENGRYRRYHSLIVDRQ